MEHWWWQKKWQYKDSPSSIFSFAAPLLPSVGWRLAPPLSLLKRFKPPVKNYLAIADTDANADMLAGTGSIVKPEAKEDKSKQIAHVPHVIRTRELTSRSMRSFPPDIIRMPSPSPSPSPSITKPNTLGTSSTYLTEHLDNSDRYQTSRTHHPASNFLWAILEVWSIACQQLACRPSQLGWRLLHLR